MSTKTFCADIHEYEYLCNLYGEQPTKCYGVSYPYGPHGEELLLRHSKNNEGVLHLNKLQHLFEEVYLSREDADKNALEGATDGVVFTYSDPFVEFMWYWFKKGAETK